MRNRQNLLRKKSLTFGGHLSQLYLSKEKLDRSETGKEIRKILETEFSGELQENFYKSAYFYPILQAKTSDNTLKSILEKLKKCGKRSA